MAPPRSDRSDLAKMGCVTMEQSVLISQGQQRNPFGSYAAYGCLEPGHPDAANRARKHGRTLLLVASSLTAVSLLSTLAHAAIAAAAH
jgi:hypothetical protein